MNHSKKLLALAQLYQRQVTRAASGSSEKLPARMQRLKLKQKQFDPYVDEDIPVYLRAGFKDRISFLVTVGLIGVGLFMSGQVYYDLIVKDL